jgi:hypothetical protein
MADAGGGMVGDLGQVGLARHQQRVLASPRGDLPAIEPPAGIAQHRPPLLSAASIQAVWTSTSAAWWG